MVAVFGLSDGVLGVGVGVGADELDECGPGSYNSKRGPVCLGGGSIGPAGPRAKRSQRHSPRTD